jgi:hypothetical protein
MKPLPSTDDELLCRAAAFFDILQHDMHISVDMYIRINRWLLEFNRNRRRNDNLSVHPGGAICVGSDGVSDGDVRYIEQGVEK